jgi:hypothetical protein
MKIKKLVLGLCALAAVAGGTPQAFGTLDALRRIVLNGKDGILSDDKGRQAEYTKELEATSEHVDEENWELALMRKEEVELVEEALTYEHLAYFYRGVAAYEKESCRTSSIRQQLEAEFREASKISTFAIRAKKLAEGRVKALQDLLVDAKVHDARALEKCKQHNNKAKEYTDEALALIKRASDLREQRIERFANVAYNHVIAREHGQDVDRGTLENSNYTTVQKEKIRVRALKDLIIWAADDGLAESRVVARIKDAIHSHLEVQWEGYAREDLLRNNLQMCKELQKKYYQKAPKLGYKYNDLSVFKRQMSKLDAAFGGAIKLQGDTRLHWEGEKA